VKMRNKLKTERRLKRAQSETLGTSLEHAHFRGWT
jgi:hypothetical protein